MFMANADIYSKLDNIKGLPAIPEIMFDALKAIKTSPGNVLKLAGIIGKDQGMVTKILSVANSPLYGMLRKVSNLEFAIMIMGSNELENIITAISLSNAFSSKSSVNFNEREYFGHSISVGLVAKDIARNLGLFDIAGEAFVAGMLHDIGIQLFAKYFTDDYKTVYNNLNLESSFLDKEIELLGMTHQELGAYLLNKWELPHSLVECIENHHKPSNLEKNELISVVHFADYIVNKYSTAKANWDDRMILDYSIKDALEFPNSEAIDKFASDYSEVINDTISSMKL